MPIIQLLIDSDKNRSANELELLLNKKANNLLSKEATHSVVQKITQIKSSLMPYFNIYSWLTFLLPGVISGFYFGLKLSSPTDTAIIIIIHIIAISSAGYITSKFFTQRKRQKLKLKTNARTLERIPAIITTLILAVSVLFPTLLEIDSRWSVFFKTEQLLSSYIKPTLPNKEIISNENLIKIGQKYLVSLGYKSITIDGNYNNQTVIAVKDFQNKFGLEQSKFINRETMTLLTKYAVIRENSFNLKKN